MAKHFNKRMLPEVTFDLVDVDPRPIDLKKAKKAYPEV